VDAISRDRITVFAGVPTMYSALLHHPGARDADVTSLPMCVSGGRLAPDGVAARIRAGLRL
jgi:long-chain acyl-CoA synthetase